MTAMTAHTQSRPWKRWLLIAGGVICLLSWIALGVGLAMDVTRPILIALATAAVLSTEGLVWLAALAMGLKVFEARQQLLGRLKRMLGLA